jgi:WD40 repeat protein
VNAFQGPAFACAVAAGSIDGKIRVWSIVDASVIATVQLHQDMVTAVSFSLNGSRIMAGTMRGRVRFYDLAEGKLEYVAQVRVCGPHSMQLGVFGSHNQHTHVHVHVSSMNRDMVAGLT